MFKKRMWGMFLDARNDNRQITDLLQISREEMEFRTHCRDILRRHSEWKKMHSGHDLSKAVSYTKIEGLLLKKQVQDAIFFYRLVKSYRIRAFAEYVNRLPAHGIGYGASQ